MRFPGERELATIRQEAFKLEEKAPGDLAAYFGEIGTNAMVTENNGIIVDSQHAMIPKPGYSPVDTISFSRKPRGVPEDQYTRQTIYKTVRRRIGEETTDRQENSRLQRQLREMMEESDPGSVVTLQRREADRAARAVMTAVRDARTASRTASRATRDMERASSRASSRATRDMEREASRAERAASRATRDMERAASRAERAASRAEREASRAASRATRGSSRSSPGGFLGRFRRN